MCLWVLGERDHAHVGNWYKHSSCSHEPAEFCISILTPKEAPRVVTTCCSGGSLSLVMLPWDATSGVCSGTTAGECKTRARSSSPGLWSCGCYGLCTWIYREWLLPRCCADVEEHWCSWESSLGQQIAQNWNEHPQTHSVGKLQRSTTANSTEAWLS